MPSAISKTPSPPPSLRERPDNTLHLPRLLCLHGGGTNSRIMRTQCRALRPKLESSFRLVYVDAPFVGLPGPNVGIVYAKWAPFRNWMPGTIEPQEESGVASISGSPKIDLRIIASIDACIEAAMADDDRSGATGPWVGLMGFSRGAQLAASLLLRQQERVERGLPTTDFRFALLMAGPAPLFNMSTGSEFQIGADTQLQIPTVHVYGTRDSVLKDFKYLLADCSTPESVSRYDWDADHQIPLKTVDVDAIMAMVSQVARQTGAIGY